MYGTFRKDEKREGEDFPWFMFCLFLVILSLYGIVMYGSWSVAVRLELFAERSKSMVELLGHAAVPVGLAMRSSFEEDSAGLNKGLAMLRLEAVGLTEGARKLEDAYERLLTEASEAAVADYSRQQNLLLAHARRVEVISEGFEGRAQQPGFFLELVSAVMSVVRPLAEVIPRHQVASRSLEGSMRSISRIQRGLVQMESGLSSVDASKQELLKSCSGFVTNVSILDNVSMVASYEDLVRKGAGEPAMNFSTLKEMSDYLASDFVAKLLQLKLVEDVPSMADSKQHGIKDQILDTREAAQALVNTAMMAKVQDLQPLNLTLQNVTDELAALESYSLATGLLMHHLVRDVAGFYKKTVLSCVAVASLMALLAFFYACYLEHIYENEGVARALQTDPKERRGCCWMCVTCIGYLFRFSGFYALMLLQDAVSLSLVLMTLVMGLVSLAQMGVASSCATPFMEDLACSDGLQRLGGFIHRELLETSCGRAELLMCDSVDSMLVSRTLLAAVLGTTVSCCIPRRLLVAWMSAQQSVHTAEVLADLHRGGKPELVSFPVP